MAICMAALSGAGQNGVCYEPADSVFVETALAEASEAGEGTCFPLFFARKFIGRPYVAHTLEVNDDERLVVNMRQLDCTTLVESATALTICAWKGQRTFADYAETLKKLRYRRGLLNGYQSRIHYFTEWILDNASMGFVEEVQSPDPPFSAMQTVDVHYMTDHPSSYKALKTHPELLGAIGDMERSLTGRTFKYIPKADVVDSEAMRLAVRDGDIIAITSGKDGLDIAHVGFAVWHTDGLHLLNASMLHHKVVEEPMLLRDYLARHPSQIGIRIVRIKHQ